MLPHGHASGIGSKPTNYLEVSKADGTERLVRVEAGVFLVACEVVWT